MPLDMTQLNPNILNLEMILPGDPAHPMYLFTSGELKKYLTPKDIQMFK